MSENNPKKENPGLPENQAQRWIKYGSNVALTVVLAIVLAVMLTWVAQRTSLRADTTRGGSLSLKPQTLQVLKQLKQHITLVSLYTHTLTDSDETNMAQRVADLLDEYKRHNGNIDVKVIDPISEKDKLEDLHQEFITKYGSQIKSYKDYLTDWKAQYEQVRKLTNQEADVVRPFASTAAAPTGDEDTPVSAFVRTITDALPQRLQDAKDAVDRELTRKHPDYKGAVTTARNQMETVSQLAGSIIEQAPKAQAIATLPAEFRKYLADSTPRYQQIKKMCDDMISRADKLGELKVDQLEQALNVDNPILVLGENEWRILSLRQVWQDDPDVKAMANGQKILPRFAGEQQITTAIYTLESPKKPKVCFVRPGGQPLTSPGFPPFSQGGPLSIVADRLREYNFDVTEKDLSGQWAMQAQMQRMPSAPEPSDEEIKDAVWVVLDFANEQQQPTAPPAVAAKLAEHLKQGGSALVLVEPRGENLNDVLKDWGVKIHPEAIAVHEAVTISEGAAAADPMEEAKGRPYIFDVRNYGDHLIAKPEQNLDSVFVPICPVDTMAAPGANVTALLPLSQAVGGLKTWGETDIDALSRNEPPAYQPDKGDLPPPTFGGAAVEKGNGRLVVFGSASFMFNRLVRFPDPNLLRRGMIVSRFPGNLELATNSIFWLAKLDPMIAISPTAMDVSRISGDLSPGMLRFWRIGVLLVLLPGLVIAGGLGVYAARKE
jgi:hypothetical protein